MKKKMKLVVCMFCLVLLTACTNDEDTEVINNSTTQDEKQENEDTNNTEENPTKTEGNILVAYFTFPETDGSDASAGASRVVENANVVGNTELFANVISERTGGDLHKIETVQNYPGSHEPLINQASDEKDEDYRPELSSEITNLDQYDTIFIGYPNWWGDLPMPLYSFLEEYDFSGKTIIPFSTHGGSGFSSTVSTIRTIQSNATISDDGLTISRNDITNSQEDIESWLSNLEY